MQKQVTFSLWETRKNQGIKNQSNELYLPKSKKSKMNDLRESLLGLVNKVLIKTLM